MAVVENGASYYGISARMGASFRTHQLCIAELMGSQKRTHPMTIINNK